ncbi:MAG: T9SS type A sorting domain-containing protein [Calditrichaceae bacterium]|nr:T9SS type A sorting domain-containing protein [Calditrichia bacterium]NUQ41568.1 T9SS type A sorting domain-containing protein [Calditrichaceae bacterium]
MFAKFSTIFALLLCLAFNGFSKGEKTPAPGFELILGDTAIMKVNNVELPLNNNGSTGEDGQGYYPAGSNLTFLFSGGMAATGYIDNDLRTAWMAPASLIEELQPGKWGMNPNDPSAEFYQVTLDDGPGSLAYLEWADAVSLGADFIDQNGDGMYDPFIDRPALMGYKTLWTVFNDGTTLSQRNRLQTLPIGLEILQTAWAYQHGGPLDDVVFFRWQIINAGNTEIEELIHSIWADPDLGDANDDLIGCDTLLNIGYIYNDGDDVEYGANPPAFGMKLLQGALVDSPGDTAYVFRGVFKGVDTLLNKKNLPWTSFMYYINGDPVIGDPSNKEIARNYQVGGLIANGNPLDPTLFGTGGTAQTNPKYVYSGDPVTFSGWLDNVPGDKRFLVNNGPFNVAPGDSQDIVFAYVVGRGTDALNSITVMRERSIYIDEFFPWGRMLNITVNETLLPIDSVFVFDANLQALAYPDTIVSVAWQLTQRPPGSAAQLIPGPGYQQFLDPDSAGDYTVRLEAAISSGGILERTVTVTAVDSRPPVAHLTLMPSQAVYGASILADASASSDPDGDPLSFDWTFPTWATANNQDTSIIEFYPRHTGSGKVEVAVSDPYFTRTAEDSFTVVPDMENLVPQVYSSLFNNIAQLSYVNGKILVVEQSSGGIRWLHSFDPSTPGIYYLVLVSGQRFVTDGTICASYGGRSTIELLFDPFGACQFSPASDTILYGSQAGSRARDIYLQYPYLYVPLRSPRELRAYEVSDPYAPLQVGSYPITPLFPVDAAYEGNIAAIYGTPNSLVTFDISMPNNIIPLDTLTFSPTGVRYVAMGGGKIYVSNGDMGSADQVQIVDALQPNNLQLAATISVESDWIMEMEAQGNLLILGLNTGVRLYDVTDPNAPVEIAHRLSGFPVYGMAWNDPQFYMVENGEAQFGGGYYYFDHLVGVEPGGDLSGVPGEFELLQNYPNPFNPETTIRYSLPVAAKVELSIYNLLGQKIRRLAVAQQAAGRYQVQWDGRSDGGNAVASGLYFYRLKAVDQGGKKFEEVKKMLFLK